MESEGILKYWHKQLYLDLKNQLRFFPEADISCNEWQEEQEQQGKEKEEGAVGAVTRPLPSPC